MIGFWLSALGLAIGAGMGLYAMLNPRWAAKLVRLRDDPEKPGGFAEFRGTYGGLFFASHATGLSLLRANWGYISEMRAEALAAGANPWIDVAGPEKIFGALLICATMWWGTAVGRGISMVLDKSVTRFNLASLLFEVVLGILILLSPILVDSV